ncbi:MAG TPA: hypothetical protein VL181_04685 [Holophagaceae bacterium]|jgi:hypothetical protein|nr:hypothetical protein [Holophagaceae bacterium]
MRALPTSLALALALSTPALQAAPADAGLTGTWHIASLSAAKGHGDDMGDLRVDAAGGYQWSEKRQLAGLGSLLAHRPSGGARAGQDCWRLQRGKGDLYIYRDGASLEVYDAASNTLVGKGTKTGSKRR